jgi:uncharacterized protein (DUF2267 family)
MTFDKFVGKVQHRAKLGSLGEAVRAIQATFQTLSDRLDQGEVKDLASQLPRELAFYLRVPEHSTRMSLDEFFQKVGEREGTDPADAVYHARVVIEVLEEAVSSGEIKDIRSQLPKEWNRLFEAGSQGQFKSHKAPSQA